MPIYHDYAPYYDGSGQIRFAILTSQYLGEVLAHHPVAGRRALDLACGTGVLAAILADDGWQVVGLDRSAPMLALARARAADAPLGSLLFIEGDMRNFNDERRTMNDDELSEQYASSFILHRSSFDLVTC